MSTAVTTNSEVRLSYEALLEPRAANKDKPDVLTYSVSIIIPKDDTETVNAFKAAAKEALELGIAQGKFKSAKGLKNPIRDADDEGREDPAYENSYFVNAKGPKGGKEAPILLDKDYEVTDSKDKVYSGVYGRVQVQFYPFDVNGNKGVACGITTFVSSEHGEPLANVVTVESARAAFGAPPSAGSKAKAEFEGKAAPAAAAEEPAAEAASDDSDPWD